jgi:murein DD-endopeptidase MepM/ murein hydrolase activator NlpD
LHSNHRGIDKYSLPRFGYPESVCNFSYIQLRFIYLTAVVVKIRRSFLLKPEITHKAQLVPAQNVDREVPQSRPFASTPRSPVSKKIASVFGNHRSRTQAVMLGLAVLMGISSVPANYPNTVAVAEELVSTDQSGSVNQYRRDVARMQAQYSQPASTLVAQVVSSPRGYQLPATNPTTSSSLQFNGEASVSIDVAQPKTKTFKAVATASPYGDPGHGSEGEFGNSEEREPGRTGETTLGYTWPAAGTVTSRFGRRWGRMHKGIDIAGPIGTPINAAADGIVTAAGWQSGGYGNLVEIRHSDGTTTRYGHNSQISVSIGQTVRQGEQVARMGSTGRSTGSHLHFEIRPSGGSAVNPIAHLPANS